MNTRTAHRTTVLPTGGGPDGSSPVIIRRGENVAFCVYAMHRRKDLYGEDAEQFRPERWEEDLPLFQDDVTAAWGYLPFNGGPRVCLGRMLTHNTLLIFSTYSLHSLLQRTSLLLRLLILSFESYRHSLVSNLLQNLANKIVNGQDIHHITLKV